MEDPGELVSLDWQEIAHEVGQAELQIGELLGAVVREFAHGPVVESVRIDSQLSAVTKRPKSFAVQQALTRAHQLIQVPALGEQSDESIDNDHDFLKLE